MAAGSSAPAQTGAPPDTPPPSPPGGQKRSAPANARQQPTLLKADQVTYDESLGIVTATGEVELSQAGRVVMADTVSYNQKTKVVIATGTVRLIEPTGEVLFTTYAELSDDLRNAFVENVRLLLKDNARIAANEGERTEGRFTRMSRAVYSPCNLCPEDPTRPPLWQIKAVRVVHDNVAQEVRYKDAIVELGGFPVAYTPYLSHPDPNVERRSGFLAPVFGRRKDLGAFLRNYYYFDIAPDKDATLEVTPFTDAKPLLGGDWRQRFENGRLRLSGTMTRGEYGETSGRIRTNRFRGHLLGDGLFDIDDTWRWGFRLARVTDDTFLRQYYSFRENILESRGFVEGFHGRNYATAAAYRFQDLRPTPGGRTRLDEEPFVAPLALYSALGEPNSVLGGRWSLDAGLLAVSRRDPQAIDSRRLSIEPGWQRDFVADAGFITTVSTSVRGDFYDVNNFRRFDESERVPGRDGSTARLVPQAQIQVRYPLVRQTGSVQQLIEPIAALTAAPGAKRRPDVPNEDSRYLELDDSNLFRASRFTGIDRVDGGRRVSYGLRAGLFGLGGGSTSLLVGQSYRFNPDDSYPAGSGLEDKLSDVVGRLDVVPSNWLDLNYGFRLDKDTFKPNRHELTATAGSPIFRLRGSYYYLDKVPADRAWSTANDATRRKPQEYLTVGASSAFAQNWSVSLAHSQAINPDPGPRSSALVLSYEDECFVFQAVGQRDYTEQPGVDAGTTVFFRLVFKTLGEVKSPNISASLFRTESDQQSSTTSP